MEIPKQLKNEIETYCKLNKILDYNAFIIKCIRQGFTSEKFGAIPAFKVDISSKKTEENISDTDTNAELNIDLTKKNKKDLYGE